MDYLDRIKKIKSEKKITNEKLSKITGIPLGTISKILAGFSDSPKLSNMVLICSALDCSLDYIVTGIPDNTNNFTLDDSEIKFITDYRGLDERGKSIVGLVLDKEVEYSAESMRVTANENSAKILYPNGKPGRTKKTVRRPTVNEFAKRIISLYNLPVSAGVGVFLDESTAEEINIPDNVKTKPADYALRIKGNSMEPKFHDGDILLVQECDSVEEGELGIFILDGDGYFKVYGGDRLISLNKDYGDILLKDFDNAVCAGRVVGKLKRK